MKKAVAAGLITMFLFVFASGTKFTSCCCTDSLKKLSGDPPVEVPACKCGCSYQTCTPCK